MKVTRVTIRNADGSVASLGPLRYYGQPANPRSHVGSRTGVAQFVSQWVRQGDALYAEVETGEVVFGPPERIGARR